MIQLLSNRAPTVPTHAVQYPQSKVSSYSSQSGTHGQASKTAKDPQDPLTRSIFPHLPPHIEVNKLSKGDSSEEGGAQPPDGSIPRHACVCLWEGGY